VWREGYVPGGDTRFFVRALGHGDDLAVLLHGWPEDGSSWRRVAPLLVDAGYRVVCPDLKGFGLSDTPHKGYDAQTLADEISQLIRNLHVRKAVLVGHDWGGAVALATAFRHPGRVRALVVASSPFRQLDLRRSWHIPLWNLPVAPEVAFKFGARPLVAAAVRHAAVADEAFTDEILDGYAEAVSKDPAAWLAYYRTLSRRAVASWALRRVRGRAGFLPDPPEPHHLRVPASVIWGELDPVTPFHLAPRVAHDLDADLVSLPGVGHFVHEEDPLAVARAIVELAGPGRGSSVPTGADRAG
jgi:epoxide hydrolase 4